MALASRLAGFPLALATAGAYIGQSAGGCSAREYLVLYDQQSHELRENADQLLEYEDRTLFSTWNMSLEQVRKQNSAAAHLMAFLAYFGNSGLDYELFRTARDKGYKHRANWLEALTESKSVFNKAMALLQNYSLVEYSPQGYSLHTCVHDWTLQTLNEKLDPERYWDAMICVASNVTTVADKVYSWQNNKRLVQHATQLWRVQLRQPFHADLLDENQAYSLNRIGILLWQQEADFDRAESLLSCALNATERLFGSNNEMTLSDLADLAVLYTSMNRLIDAEEIYRRALEVCKKNLLPTQDQRSRIQHNLALLYIDQDKLLEAKLLLRDALAQNEVALGINDPQTMHTACTLAAVLIRLDTVREAEILSQEAAEGLKKTLGMYHPVTLDAIGTRADVHFFLDQLQEAEISYKMVLEGNNKFYGVGHKESLKAARSLGNAYLKLKKLDELVQLVRNYGDLVPELFWPLGYLYVINGDDQKAIMAFRRLYQDYDGMPSWRSAFCDGCQTKDDALTAAMGLNVCRTCDDIILCFHCYEQRQAGLKVLERCVGHAFFVVPAEALLAPI